MVFQRACVAFLSLGLIASASAQTHAQTHASTKQAAKIPGTVHRAPAAKGAPTKKTVSKKTPAKKPGARSVAATTTSRTVRGRVATVAPASYATREATMAHITESLASVRVGIENPDALQPFFDQLKQLESDPKSSEVRILQFGDSHTAADMFTGALRTLFQTKFGDGGAGYSYPGYPFAGYRIHGTHRAQSVGWTVTGTHFRDLGDGMLGMGGVSLSTVHAGDWISLDADATSVEVQYLVQPGGGNIEIYDGDTLLTSVSTDGETAAGHYDAQVAAGPHHFEVRTISSAPVRLFGLVTEQPAGVTYEAIGLNGAEAGVILKWNEPLADDLMSQRNLSLIVLAYGTNEASDSNWSEESYAAMFRTLIERLRKQAPKAAILVLGPADRELRQGRSRRAAWVPYDGIDRIIRAQRAVCRQMGCAYWDERARMGGFGTMREWVSVGWGQGDHTHFTGEGYNELAASLFSDIVQQYNRYEGNPAIAAGEAK